MKTSESPPLVLEIAAAALVPAAAFGFSRIFVEVSATLPIIGASLLSTAVAVAARRARFPLPVAMVVSMFAGFVLIASRYAPGTSRWGVIPTAETIDQLQLLVDDGLLQFRELRAPVEAIDPFVAASMVAAWLMAFLTDWGGLRLRLAFEPVLPAGLLFIFSAVLGSGDRQVISTLVFAVAVVFWSIAQRTVHLAERGVWLSIDRRRGPAGLARAGAAFAAVAVVVGLVAGPRLPGADAEELYYWRSRGEPSRVVVSPFVNIENRLASQQDVELFRVQTNRPAYWRLAGLDAYEEGFWQTKSQFEPESGGLPGDRPREGTTISVRQTYEIERLSAIWLPAAFAPANLISSDVDATWNSDTGSLTVSSDVEDSNGISYTIESVVSMFSADELNRASPRVPDDIAERYLALPEDITPRLASEAAAITAGASTRYEQMIALQEHFRQFDYSLNLAQREGDPIEQFLDERVGFCQQFSGTFALMARQLGAPARVAVGFTWGDPDGEGGYVVTGRHTHAWPEVWFEGFGWVAFEPTPGRGAPDAVHTALNPQQDSLVQPDEPLSTTTTVPQSGSTTQPSLNIPQEDLFPDAGGASGSSSGGGVSLPWRLVAVAGLVLGWAIGLPLYHRYRRARRHQQATTPTAQIEAVWADTAEDLETGFGLDRRSWETRTEFAERAGKDRRVPADALAVVAASVTDARYRAGPPTRSQVDAAHDAGQTVRAAVHKRVSWWQRWLNDIDPRRLLHPSVRVVAAPSPPATEPVPVVAVERA